MIIKILQSFVSTTSSSQLSDLFFEIMEHGHYVECDYDVQQSLICAIDNHGSTTQKELARKYKGFDLTNEFRKYLTTISTDDYSLNQLSILVSKPSKLLMENLREWPVYQSIIGTYKRDRLFSNLFQLLESAKSKMELLPLQSGGVTEMPQVFNDQNTHELKDVAAQKICFILDRDTDGSYLLPGHNTIKMLSGEKDVSRISNNHIYALQQNNYIWHMWFRRDIESYFPKERFFALGYSVKDPSIIDSYYAKAEDKYVKGVNTKYNKNDTRRLPETMSKLDYEVGLQTFNINGIVVNELQLLLLKFVKII